MLRELGGIYVAARQYGDARNELEIYTERRPYEPEGLYYYGQTMEGLGNAAAAREAYAEGIRALILFGLPEHKDEIGSAAWSPDGIVQRALRALGREVPGIATPGGHGSKRNSRGVNRAPGCPGFSAHEVRPG